MKKGYKEWLGPFYGLKPHRYKHDGSFNNIVFSTELLIGKMRLGTLDSIDIGFYNSHTTLTNTPEGLYAPKNSHDNLTAKFCGLHALHQQDLLDQVDVGVAQDGKHPRDWIFYGWFFKRSVFYTLLLPLAMLDIVRAIFSSGKVRPKFWDKRHFKFRLYAALGFIEPEFKDIKIHGGTADRYQWEGRDKHINYVQNDGKILNLFRLHMMKDVWYLKPFVKLCKWFYKLKMGENFQSVMFANYFEESDHPVREVFAELDKHGLTVID